MTKNKKEKKKYKYCVICKAVDEEIPTFGFPNKDKDDATRKLWTTFCDVDEVSVGAKLCAKHFSDEDIIKRKSSDGGSNHRLKKNAIPSLLPQPQICKTPKRERLKICFICDCQEKGVSYFTFPEDPDLRKKWMFFCKCSQEDAEMMGKNTVLCEKHFEERDIIRKRSIGTGYAYDTLILNAVPKYTI